jgi:predicted component of type VI protein secretion system
MGNLDKLKVKKPKPLVLDQTNAMLAPPDPARDAAAQSMPTGTFQRLTTGTPPPAAAEPAESPKKGHRGKGRPKPPPVHPADQDQHGRLPHLASFHCVYHALDRQWTGSLVVEGKEFRATASGLFTLERNLDALYRASLHPQAVEGPGE